MPRVVWKGAISFGLVHVPVVLYAGARRGNLDFDWIDKRDMSPVGYARINKRTGKAIDFNQIVKGYEYQKGEYVLLSDEDFRQANPKATQTVEIVSFVDLAELPPYYFATPYYLAPDKRGEKGYALLRETLRKTGRAGVANVVLHTKQHLAAVLVVENVLLLNTLRYPDEIQSRDELELPGTDLSGLGISRKEVEMATRLVNDMTEAWNPDKYRDTYRDDLLARIEEKIESGETRALAPADEDDASPASGNVIDLMAMLKKSIASRTGGRPPASSSDDTPEPVPGNAAPRGTARASARKSSKAAGKKTPARGESKAKATRPAQAEAQSPGSRKTERPKPAATQRATRKTSGSTGTHKAAAAPKTASHGARGSQPARGPRKGSRGDRRAA